MSVLNDVTGDLEDEKSPTLFTTTGGKTAAIWIREKGTVVDNLSNSLLYSELNNGSWSVPTDIPGITGANREVRTMRDANGELLVVFVHSDMSAISNASTAEETINAYDESDLCYIRRTENGWTTPQLLGKIPGNATGLRLHVLPDGSSFATWTEHHSSDTDLYAKKWDPDTMIWLPSSKLSAEIIASVAAIGSVDGNPTAVWSQGVPSEEGVADFLGGEQLMEATLSNGSWGSPVPFELAFEDFIQEATAEPSLLSNNQFSTDNLSPRLGGLVEFFDINQKIGGCPKSC